MKEKLNGYHIFILIHMIQIGVGIFSLPRVVAEHFGYNGWLILFVVAGVAALNIFLMWNVWKMGKGESVYVICERYIPKWLIYSLYVVVSLGWSLTASLVTKIYVLIFQVNAFPTANPMVFMLAMSALAYVLIIKGIYTITKASTVFFYLVVWMVLLQLTFYNDVKLSRFTHYVFKEGKEYWKGGMNLYSSFLGYEFSLLLFPYVQPKTRFFTAVQLGNLYTFLVYLSVTVICFGFYSTQQLKLIMFPFIDLLAYIKFPFIERVENVLYSFLLFTVLITVVIYHWAASLTMQRIFKHTKVNRITFYLMAITYLISFIPSVIDDVGKWLFMIGYFNIGISFVFPICLIGILSIQRWRKQLA